MPFIMTVGAAGIVGLEPATTVITFEKSPEPYLFTALILYLQYAPGTRGVCRDQVADEAVKSASMNAEVILSQTQSSQFVSATPPV